MIRQSKVDRLVYIILLLVFFTVAFDVEAQKRSSKNQKEELPNEELLWKAESSLIEAEKQIILENYTKAYDLLLITRDINPNDPAVYFKLAEVVLKNGENEAALEYIDEAINLNDQNKFYRIFKAEIQKTIGQYNQAIETYELLIEEIKGTETYLYDLALLYQYRDQFEKALSTYKRAEDIFGLSVEVMREKQRIYLRTMDMESLIQDWDNLISENPLNPEYILEFCSVLINNQLFEEASIRLGEFLEKNPDELDVYMFLADIELKTGNTEKALDLMQKPVRSPSVEILSKVQVMSAISQSILSEKDRNEFEKLIILMIEAHPKDFQSYAFAGDIMMQNGEKQKALDYYRIAANLSPVNFGIWQNIVSIEVENAEYDSLVYHAEKALEYFPNQAIFYFYGGVGYYFKENYKRSTTLLEQGKKYTNDPGLLAVFYGQLGDAYNSMQDYVKSDAAYEKALENDPANDHALNNYSYFLSLRKTKLDRALEMSSKLVESYPDNATYLDTHGWVLFQMERYQEAEKFLGKAAEMEDDGTVLEHYGDVLYKLGDVDDAVDYWKKAREAGGASEKIDEKIESEEYYD